MFQRLYNDMMADIDYSQIMEWMRPYLHLSDVVVDAGCGPGYVMLELIQSGYHVIGLDIDGAMLAIAKDKLESYGHHGVLYEHDLRTPMRVKVDVIYALFDVMNYFKGTKKVIKNIYHALNKGGRFLFDIYQESLLETYQDYEESDDEQVSYRWTIKRKQNQLIHCVQTDHGTYRLNQYLYPLSYYTEQLREVGFKVDINKGPDERKHYIIAYK